MAGGVCPSLLVGVADEGYCPSAREALFAGLEVSPFLDFSLGDGGVEADASLGGISVSGVQEKFSAVVHGGRLALARGEERGTHILKPPPLVRVQDRKALPPNEHLTMQLAAQVYGIAAAPNGLCFDSQGQTVYVCRRFDLAIGGGKYAQEDLHALRMSSGSAGAFPAEVGKYEGSYEELAGLIAAHASRPELALAEFLRRLVFSYIYCNGDAHAKNFTLLSRDGEVVISPAYDLLNTELHLRGDDFALRGGLSEGMERSEVYQRTGHPCRSDFARFGERIGLEERVVGAILDAFMELPPSVYALVERSFLPTGKLKRQYLRTIGVRRERFVRGEA